ncbi:ATP-binding protein [Candidatus Parabeggiatoa sp. HSG14]|uniref:AAA family ATPase n=1 Tax=Candidatus Parabeggiatoa sp. HSG14 TaxID=3055593 RepID=UPI0025A7F94B|nr:ATP-binding protein [Thiotrichales bacterium HSG14]
MIKSIYIDNFKILNDFRLNFEPVTVLIGENSVGKSTVLQALELLSYFTQVTKYGTIDNYLSSNGWAAKEIKSTLSRKQLITFQLDIAISNNLYQWHITFKIINHKLSLVTEWIRDKTGHEWLFRKSGETKIVNKDGTCIPTIPDVSFLSSGLSFLNENSHQKDFSELIALKQYLNNIYLFDFSGTDKLKSSGHINNEPIIGKFGEYLTAFLYHQPKTVLAELSKKLADYIPFMKNIRIKKKHSGAIELDIQECFNSHFIKANYLSDGVMRILAIISLSLMGEKANTMMIEEIEDGINPYLIEKIVETLMNIAQSEVKQFILTTHNPLILDWMLIEGIYLLYRNKESGQVRAKRFSDSSTVINNLDYMNPGEIWINFDKESIVSTSH